MKLWPLLLGVALSGAELPEKWFTILPEPTRQSQMYAWVNANIPPLPQFRTLGEWQAYKAKIRPRILSTLGIDDILAKHTLKVTSRGVLDREGYVIEKINFESYPGMQVPALVWIPKGLGGKAPAMVSITGHSYCDSKAAGYIQARNYNLVKRGFIIVSYDYFGCFERNTVDACQKGVFGGVDHTNSLFSYTRRTPTGIEVLDGIRALDYLYSRPDVDRSRIGFTGESGGGNSTYWVSALDERVTLSVPVSAAGSFAQWIKDDLDWDWHQRPTGIRAFADIGTLYALVAPKPLLIMNGRPELAEFALPDALRSIDYARAVYRLYGKPEAVAFYESTTGHGYQEDKRAELYKWLDRWFFAGKMPHGASELPYQPEPKDALRVGLPQDNLTIPALAIAWVREALREYPLPANATEARSWQVAKRLELDLLLGRHEPRKMPVAVYNYGDDRESGDYRFDRFRFEVAPDMLIPGIFIRPKGQLRYKTILVARKGDGLSSENKALLNQGYALLLLDVRGTGEVDWSGSRTSNWAQFTGRPAIGMWAEDISKVVTWLLARKDVESVSVLGKGIFGKAALYAAAMDERIAAAAVTTDTLSYRQEATSGLKHVFADVPRILTWGDTPQLAALVAPRPLVILGAGLPASDNQEKPTYFAPVPRFRSDSIEVSQEELRLNYEWTQRFYRLFGAESRFRVVAQPLETWFR